MSLGSIYSLARTLRNVDQLPLDVYKRAEFVLDARVRLQQSQKEREQGSLGGEDGEDSRREERGAFVVEHIFYVPIMWILLHICCLRVLPTVYNVLPTFT